MARDNSRGRKWDGKSRVSNDLYRKNYNKIFQKKDDPFNIEVNITTWIILWAPHPK